jgi:hypothetical protein
MDNNLINRFSFNTDPVSNKFSYSITHKFGHYSSFRLLKTRRFEDSILSPSSVGTYWNGPRKTPVTTPMRCIMPTQHKPPKRVNIFTPWISAHLGPNLYLHALFHGKKSLKTKYCKNLSRHCWAIWVGSTWRRRQNPVCETSWFKRQDYWLSLKFW